MSQDYGPNHLGLEYFNQHLEFFSPVDRKNDQCLLNTINILITVICLSNQFNYSMGD